MHAFKQCSINILYLSQESEHFYHKEHIHTEIKLLKLTNIYWLFIQNFMYNVG